MAFAITLVQADVIELGDSDFDSRLETIDDALVMFYAPWCGHCKKLKPEYEEASVDLAKNDPPVVLAKVDCTEAGKDTCSRFQVSGFPTMKIFKSGELAADYNGPRDAEGIVRYMKTQVGPASKEFKTEGDLKKHLDNVNEPHVVGILKDDKDFSVFEKVAVKLRDDVSFVHARKAVGSWKAGVHLHRPKNLQSKFEDSTLKFAGKLDDKDAIEDWIKKNYHGLAGHRTPNNAKDFHETLAVVYYDVDYVKNPKGTNYWRNRVMKVAKNFPKINFAVSNKNDFQHELSEYGWDHVAGDKPVVALKNQDGKKFKMEDSFDVEAFTKFLTQYEAGKLEPHIKSEPIPENNDGGVKVAVGKNFNELVTKSDKDVLIEFYAPWCGHCKQLAPIYDELGETMKDENVEIVKMDATANDVPSPFSVQGFPTIYWVKKGEEPVSYSGGRQLNDFVKYIAEHATNELEGFSRKGRAKKDKKAEL